MRIIISAIIAITIIVFAQTQMIPAVMDNGGGIAQNSSHKLLSSIGQSVMGVRSDGTTIEAGYVTAELDLVEIREQHHKPLATPFIGEFSPNPFNSATAISVFIPADGRISMKLLDISGREIYSWSEEKTAGTYSIKFTADKGLPAGTYFYVINALNHQRTGKIAFIK